VLEERVAERTAVAENRTRQLQNLAAELTEAEQRERRRIAQVLHDHLQQLLVAARMHLGVTRSQVHQAGASDALSRVDDLLSQSIEASRTLTAELCPPILHSEGLPAALEWLAQWKKEKHHLVVEVDVDKEANPASESVRNLVFQVIWELLFNVVKHSGESGARVVMRQRDGTLHVTVEDRGKGFDPSSIARSSKAGFGLFSIQQRLDTIGGDIVIDSAPGRGTRVHITAPMSIEQPVS
jgi:signal transduction histidine kinase